MLHKKIKYLILTVICLNILNPSQSLFADIRLYLYPRIEKGDEVLSVQDIGGIDCDTASDQIKAIEIDSTLYSDGYLDKKEIMSLIKSKTDEPVIIYGNAVRIFPKGGYLAAQNDTDVKKITVSTGQRISLRIIKKGVTLEVPGTVISINDGKDVTVRLERKSGGSKLVKCVLAENGYAEVNL